MFHIGLNGSLFLALFSTISDHLLICKIRIEFLFDKIAVHSLISGVKQLFNYELCSVSC